MYLALYLILAGTAALLFTFTAGTCFLFIRRAVTYALWHAFEKARQNRRGNKYENQL